MSPLCHLLGHLPAPDVQRNQGFAFSRCLRCRHDMIRSADAPHSRDWKRVPAGFRVHRGPARCAHRAPVPAPKRPARPSITHDLMRIGSAALFWHMRDALRSKPRRARVLRLTNG